MDRGERIRKQNADRIPLPTSPGDSGELRGVLVLRSGLSFPRMPSVLDLEGCNGSRLGVVVDYYDGVREAEARWLRGDVIWSEEP